MHVRKDLVRRVCSKKVGKDSERITHNPDKHTHTHTHTHSVPKERGSTSHRMYIYTQWIQICTPLRSSKLIIRVNYNIIINGNQKVRVRSPSGSCVLFTIAAICNHYHFSQLAQMYIGTPTYMRAHIVHVHVCPTVYTTIIIGRTILYHTSV